MYECVYTTKQKTQFYKQLKEKKSNSMSSFFLHFPLINQKYICVKHRHSLCEKYLKQFTTWLISFNNDIILRKLCGLLKQGKRIKKFSRLTNGQSDRWTDNKEMISLCQLVYTSDTKTRSRDIHYTYLLTCLNNSFYMFVHRNTDRQTDEGTIQTSTRHSKIHNMT